MDGTAPQAGLTRAAPPARLFWPAILLLDLCLLAFLSQAHWILLGAAGAASALLLLCSGPAALAFALVGLPLLQPIADWTGDSRPGFFLVYGLFLGAGLVRLWQGIWDPRRMEPALSLPRRAVWLCAFGLGALMLLGLARTPAPVYGGDKTQLYWMTNFVLLTGAIVLLSPGADRTAVGREARRFFGALLALEVVFAAGAVWNAVTGFYPHYDRLTAWGLNPIWVARHAGLGILVALLLVETRAIRRRWLWLLLPLFSWVFLRTVSRGPTLALAAALAYWFLAAPLPAPLRRGRALALGLAALSLGGLFLLELSGAEHAASQQTSNQVRLWLLAAARRGLSEVSLLGVGTGGFSAILGVPDQRWYPHNLFAEVLLENGLLGLSLVAGLVAATFLAWRRWGRIIGRGPGTAGAGARGRASAGEEAIRRGAGAIFLFALGCAQFSGDIWVNEWVWAFAGVIAAWAPRRRG